MAKIFKPGTFLLVPLADGTFGYARALKFAYEAFYEYRTESPDSDLDRIAAKPILFKITVRHLKSPWKIVGCRELEEHLEQPIVEFMQDIGDFRRCTIYDTLGNRRDAEPHECIGLERMAVWEQKNAEERLLDFFMGRTNYSVEHLKVELK